MPLFDIKQCHVRCQNLMVPTYQLIVPSTILALATNIRTYRATKTTKIRTGRLSTENGSVVDRMIVNGAPCDKISSLKHTTDTEDWH